MKMFHPRNLPPRRSDAVSAKSLTNRIALASVLGLAGMASSALATNATWNQDGGTATTYNWSDAANWVGGTAIPNGIGEIADLSQKDLAAAVASGTTTINLNGNVTLGTLLFGDSAYTAGTPGSSKGSYTIAAGSPAGKLIFDNGASNATLTQVATAVGTNTISAGITLNSNLDVTNLANGVQLKVNGTIALNGKTLTSNTLGGNTSFPTIFYNSITGNGALVVNGTGYVGIVAASSNTFSITVNSGALNLTAASIGTVGDIATTGTGTVVGFTSSTSAYSKSISGTGRFIKDAGGILTMSGLNTYTGTTKVVTGTLKAGIASQAGVGGAFGNNSAVSIDNRAATGIDITGFNTQIGSLTGGGAAGGNVTLGAATLTTGGDNTSPAAYAGIISGIGGGITKIGTGTQTFSGANTYTGATTVTSGTLKAGVASVAGVSGAFGNNSAVSLADTAGATLDLAGFNTQIGSLTGGGATGGNVTLGVAALTLGGDNTSPAAYAGAISGNGSVTKIGTGKQILSGANTYKGTTTVSAGELSVNGSLDASSTVTVAAAAILSGSGSIGGATIVDGTLAAGDGIGTLRTGNLTLNATSVFAVQLGGDGAIAASDRVDVTGSVNIASGAELKLTISGLTAPGAGDVFFLINNNDVDADETIGKFNFMSDHGLITLTEGTQFNWNNQDWTITYKADAGQLSFIDGNDVAIMAVVPEPSTWALLTGGVGMLIATQGARRRSRAS